MSQLVWAIKNGELDSVKSIVEIENIDVNKEIDGRPPLLYAADYGQEHVIPYLIKKGADVNIKDKHGISALLAAIWEGHTECVKKLIDEGACKEGTAPDGTTYFDSADKEDIRKLLK